MVVVLCDQRLLLVLLSVGSVLRLMSGRVSPDMPKLLGIGQWSVSGCSMVRLRRHDWLRCC